MVREYAQIMKGKCKLPIEKKLIHKALETNNERKL
jgi:hypothetical protein